MQIVAQNFKTGNFSMADARALCVRPSTGHAVIFFAQGDGHDRRAVEALERGTHVFAEVPLCIDADLSAINLARRSNLDKGVSSEGQSLLNPCRTGRMSINVEELLAATSVPTAAMLAIQGAASACDDFEGGEADQ